MFNQNARRLMLGAREFLQRRLVISDVSKGKNAWKVFVDRLMS